jgi:hypothetical protein
MIIQNARTLSNVELLREYDKIKILESCQYYDIMQKKAEGWSLDSQKDDIDKLHLLRSEISRVRNILLLRGFRNI